jgi:hypothetical protein
MAELRAALLNKLTSLQDKLRAHKVLIETTVDKLDNEKGERDLRRREILLQESKQVLSSLHESDEKMVKELKSEAFDKLRAVRKAKNETARLLEGMEDAVPQAHNTVEEVELGPDVDSRYYQVGGGGG